jgi:hypothetical protein
MTAQWPITSACSCCLADDRVFSLSSSTSVDDQSIYFDQWPFASPAEELLSIFSSVALGIVLLRQQQ